jgi:predicted nucleic acid-binding protein
MSVFVDTNVLLRSVQPAHPLHGAAVRAIAASIRDTEPLFITPQIVAEFWNVATRPAEQNGLGWSHQQALDAIVRIEEFFSVLIESADVYAEWKRLVVAHAVTGVQAHDARLVAAMKVHGIKRILTFNTQDFARYPDIEAIRPA